ncbi:hypothetical protein [Mycobacterium avium]|uniref:hypothetical protein n=1 Tax=Mycobacterium avium TaxID=1764 RepID=UPI000A596F2B|nr:hypothetical protein [Mycobacterium avium]
MTDLKSSSRAEPSAIEPPQIKTIRPVLFWSSLGAVCVIIAAYVYISWIASGNEELSRPVDWGVSGDLRFG